MMTKANTRKQMDHWNDFAWYTSYTEMFLHFLIIELRLGRFRSLLRQEVRARDDILPPLQQRELCL